MGLTQIIIRGYPASTKIKYFVHSGIYTFPHLISCVAIGLQLVKIVEKHLKLDKRMIWSEEKSDHK